MAEIRRVMEVDLIGTAILLEALRPLVRPGSAVVDLGCGVGAIAAAVLARVPGVEVYAIKDADVGCPAGPIDPVKNVAVGAVVKFVGTTDSAGKIRVALPPGAWRIEVKDHGLGLLSTLLSSWPTVTVGAGALGAVELRVDGLL